MEYDLFKLSFVKKSITGIKTPNPKSSKKIEAIENIETVTSLLFNNLIFE